MKRNDEDLLNEEILITIEHHNKANMTILFDFLDSKHFNRFLENYDFPTDNPNDASMIMFHNFKCSKRFQLGVYYNVKTAISELLNNAEMQSDSNIILFKINAMGRDIREFLIASNVSSQYIYESNDNGNNKNSPENAFLTLGGMVSQRKLIVKCVGQGSWNEFSFDGEVKLVYDIGTSYLHDKQTVRNLMSLRDLDYQKSKPIIVLSHWDVDHYHMLLAASDDTIKSVKAFVYRSLVPNKTSRKLIERFQNLNPSALYPVQEEPPPIGKRGSEKLNKIFGNKYGFFVFNGSKNKDRNKAGILLVLKTHTQVVILAADFYYEQINKYVLPNFHYKHNHYLIVPHHGGEAGKFIYENLNSVCMAAIISVGGKYSYNHPLFVIEEELRKKKFQLVNFKTKSSPFEYDLILH